MSYSLPKKVAVRTNRLIEELMLLRDDCQDNAADLLHMESCIAEARAAAARMADTFRGYKAPARPGRMRGPAPAPYSGPALTPPVYGPETGVIESLPKKSSSWVTKAAIEAVRDAGDDRPPAMLPADSTPAEFVQQCLDGLRTHHLCEAAKLLTADATMWALLDGDERRAEIERKARELAVADPMDDLDTKF